MSSIIHKAYAYITYGDLLLVFRQPAAPQAGIQIPGGTIEANESPAAAVLREAAEETGLPGLQPHCYLGFQLSNLRPWGLDLYRKRHYFHLLCTSEPRDHWRAYERTPHHGGTEPIAFDFFWVDWPDRTPHRAADLATLLATNRWNS